MSSGGQGDPSREYRINSDQARTIREVFERYRDGEGLRVIAPDLTARGVAPPRGRFWSAGTGRAMLRREMYVGVLVWSTIAEEIAERQKHLRAVQSRIDATRTAPSVLDLEIRRLELEARKRSSTFAACAVGVRRRRGGLSKYCSTAR
jgi:hypothetical protein